MRPNMGGVNYTLVRMNIFLIECVLVIAMIGTIAILIIIVLKIVEALL